jgi:hypothetical protein
MIDKMSKQCNFIVDIFSPAEDGIKKYKLNFTKDQLSIIANIEITCNYVDNNIDPVWKGGINKNPLVQELEGNNVFPPSNFIKAFEIAWVDWINSKLSDTQLESAIRSLIDWLNIITKTKPGNDYWADKF